MRRSVEQADGPGGGSVVRLVDPLGVAVSVHHGFAAVAPEPVRAPIPHNAPNQTVRVNDTQRPALAPPQVTKLGHLVLETPDFDRSARWYMDMLGFIPSDVMCLRGRNAGRVVHAARPRRTSRPTITRCSSRPASN